MPPSTLNPHCAVVLYTLAIAAAIAGCNSKPEPPPDPKAAFRGLTISVLVPDSPALRAWIEDIQGEWSAQTGAQVRLETYAEHDPTTPRSGLAGSALATGHEPDFDLLVFHSRNMANAVAAGLAAKFSKSAMESPLLEIKDVAPAVANQLVAWDRNVVAFPVAAECLLVYYRSDVLADPPLRERFEAEHGRPLEPPHSWDEFDQLAQFLTGIDWDGDGNPDRALDVADPGDALVARAAAYGKAPQNYSFFFDVNSFEPLVNGPAFRLAFDKWRSLAPTLAPSDSSEPVLSAFAAGKAPLAIGSSAIAIDLVQSDQRAAPAVRGKMGFVALPGHSSVYHHDRQSWSDLPKGQLNRASVVRGLCAAVPRSSRQPAAAHDFAEFVASRERSLLYVTTPRYELGAYRLSHLVDPAAWIAGGWPAAVAPTFVTAQRNSLNHANVVSNLRIDGASDFESALREQARAVLFGDAPVDDAAKSLEDSWRALSDDRGHDRLRRQYRYSLGIPVLN